MKIKFKKLYKDVILPKYQTDGASGFDIHSNQDMYFAPESKGIIGTGLAVELPPGTELQIRQRSGISKNVPNYISNAPGTIDSDFRGEVKILIVNHNRLDYFQIKKGDRIAQGIIAPVIRCEIEEVKKLSKTKRAEGAFGSTGK